MRPAMPSLGYRWGTAELAACPAVAPTTGRRFVVQRHSREGTSPSPRSTMRPDSSTMEARRATAPTGVDQQGSPVNPQVARVDRARARTPGHRASEPGQRPGSLASLGTEEAEALARSPRELTAPRPVHGLSPGAQAEAEGARESAAGLEGRPRCDQVREGSGTDPGEQTCVAASSANWVVPRRR